MKGPKTTQELHKAVQVAEATLSTKPVMNNASKDSLTGKSGMKEEKRDECKDNSGIQVDKNDNCKDNLKDNFTHYQMSNSTNQQRGKYNFANTRYFAARSSNFERNPNYMYQNKSNFVFYKNQKNSTHMQGFKKHRMPCVTQNQVQNHDSRSKFTNSSNIENKMADRINTRLNEVGNQNFIQTRSESTQTNIENCRK